MLEWLAGALLAGPPEHAASPRHSNARRATRAGATRARAADAGVTDAGITDTGTARTPAADAGVTDAGVTDTGTARTPAADADAGDARRAAGQLTLLMGRFCRRKRRNPTHNEDLVAVAPHAVARSRGALPTADSAGASSLTAKRVPEID